MKICITSLHIVLPATQNSASFVLMYVLLTQVLMYYHFHHYFFMVIQYLHFFNVVLTLNP